MSLTNTFTEIKEVLPRLVSNLSNTVNLPNFDRAEAKYIVPVTGVALYNDLLTKYNASTLSANEALLVRKIRLVSTAYAFYDELGLANVTITDTGARKMMTGSTERVFGWEYNELKSTLMDAAADGMEVLLNYLVELNLVLWTGSDEYARFKKLLIRTGTDFNDHYNLFRPMRTFYSMRPVVEDVQELYLEEAIGKDLLYYLRDAATPTDDEKECIRLLKKSLANFSVKHACERFSVMFSDYGFTIFGEKTDSMNSDKDLDGGLLSMKMKAAKVQGDDFLSKAMHALVTYYDDAGAPAEFKTAYEAGPLVGYVDPTERTIGNEKRKIFII